MSKLYLIGAGIGKGAITMRGLDALKKSDIVLYDRLIPEDIISHIDCETVDVGKTPYKHGVRQLFINDLIMAYLNEGYNVARLKGGDTSLFARSAEEIDAAKVVGADVEIIPGVTSASTLAAALETSLTDRDLSYGVVFITGHRKTGELETSLNWKALVELGLTIVVYMGIKNLPIISKNLIKNGMSGDAPVVIGENVGFDNQRILLTDLKNIENTLDRENVVPPSTVIIGDVLKLADI